MSNVDDKHIQQFVRRHARVGVDTNIVIAIVEAHLHYGDQARNVFKLFNQHGTEVWISVTTIPEVLIKPVSKKAYEIVRDYEHILFDGLFSFAPISLVTARQAALTGGVYNLHAADSLILASLIEQGVTGFITADQDFKNVTDLEILLIGR